MRRSIPKHPHLSADPEPAVRGEPAGARLLGQTPRRLEELSNPPLQRTGLEPRR